MPKGKRPTPPKSRNRDNQMNWEESDGSPMTVRTTTKRRKPHLREAETVGTYEQIGPGLHNKDRPRNKYHLSSQVTPGKWTTK